MQVSPVQDGPSVGDRIGRYRLLQCLGEGGFGIVWRAQQVEPIRREVALKIIKPGMDSRAVLRRFEAERQALAVMDHPCIARVFDGGATERGYPYFVMELVRGEPITQFCDRHRLTIRQRVELFIRVCEAVQHAHMKGVIHRDLKPANVIVTMSADGRPEPKVIDFGIAKALSDNVADRSIVTEHGQLVGTPAYMSPEQAGMSGVDIDTRADVYALGVMLYELLTGMLPFDRQRLRDAALPEVQRLICEVEPPRPSTRLANSTTRAAKVDPPSPDESRSIAENRGAELRSITGLLRRDLDWVVMKCLEKERSRRYAGPSGLAEELRRFLKDEPVQAGPPTATYRLRKLVRRHRGAVAGGAAIAAILIIATLVSIGFAFRAAKQKQLAMQAMRQTDLALQAEKQRMKELETVANFQDHMITGVEPDVMGRDLVRQISDQAREAMEQRHDANIEQRVADLNAMLGGVNGTDIATGLLDRFLAKRTETAINEQFQDQPLIRAKLLESVASVLEDLGLFDRALEVDQTAFAIRSTEQGPDAVETLVTRSNMANILSELGQDDQAMPIFESTLTKLRQALGTDDPRTLQAMSNMAAALRSQERFDEAAQLYAEAIPLHIRVYGPDHPETLTIRNNFGVLQTTMGLTAEALATQQDVLARRERTLGPDHRDTLRSLNNTARALEDAGRLPEAIEMYDRALDAHRRVLGDEHPDTLGVLSNLSVCLYTVGRVDDAIERVTESLSVCRRIFGDDNPQTLLAIGNLGAMYEAQGKYDKALPYYTEAFKTRMRVLGERDPDTLIAMANMSFLLESMGKLEEAFTLGRRALELRREVLGDDHFDTISSMSNLGALLREMNRLDEAEQLGAKAVSAARRTLAPDHWLLGAILVQHGRTLNAMSRFNDAIPELEEAVRIFNDALGSDHPRTIKAAEDLANARAGMPG